MTNLSCVPSFAELLRDRGVLLADGATATNQDMGIEPGVAPEEWVFDAPQKVKELHRRFGGSTPAHLLALAGALDR